MIVIECLFLIVILGYFLLIFPTQWMKVEHIRYDLGLNKKVLQLSDLHIKNMRVSIKRISNLIEKEKPDYIFMTGDFVDSSINELGKLEELLKIIDSFQIETYAVLGNHDYRVKNIEAIIQLLKRYNIQVLMNESIEKENFVLIGIDDYHTKHHDIKKAYSFHQETNKKKIVITHDPTIVDKMDETFDYLMAGHLHGKQINIPFLYHLKPMGSLAARGIYKNLHILKNGPIYISKGMSQTRLNVRFLVRSEATVHHI